MVTTRCRPIGLIEDMPDPVFAAIERYRPGNARAVDERDDNAVAKTQMTHCSRGPDRLCPPAPFHLRYQMV